MRCAATALLMLLAACAPEEPDRVTNRSEEPTTAPTPIAPGSVEWDKRLQKDELVSRLSRDVRLNPPPGFSAIWIEHEPAYTVFLAFKEPPDKQAILARADPALRPHIVFRTASRTQAEIERDLDRVIGAMRGIPGEWAGGYDVKTGKFVYNVTSPAGVAFAERRLPPDLRGDVTFRLGSVPQPLGSRGR